MKVNTATYGVGGTEHINISREYTAFHRKKQMAIVLALSKKYWKKRKITVSLQYF